MQDLRVISKIFSTAMFKRIVREDDSSLFQRRLDKYLDTSYTTNLDAIQHVYSALLKNYRCEYIYKNKLTLDIIKKYGLRNTLLLDELKISSSKADLVMLNGAIKVYEIKTELDSFDKLSKQIEDYQKFAEIIYIVVDIKSSKKICNVYEHTNIGIIALDSQNKFKIIKEANVDKTNFDFDTIFKILRKQEYLDLVKLNFDYIPDVPNTIIYRACYDLLSKLDVEVFQKQVLNKLKNRKLTSPNFLKSSNTPPELKHICNSLNFNEKEYVKLYNFLKSKDNICTIHI